MFKRKPDFANHCLYRELDEIPCCFIFCDVWELLFVSASHKTAIVRNSFFCCSINRLQHYVYRGKKKKKKKKKHCCAFCQLRFFTVVLHRATSVKFVDFRLYILYIVFCTEFIHLFVQKGISYSTVALCKVKRQDCYCTPCFVCKREKFDQFHTK